MLKVCEQDRDERRRLMHFATDPRWVLGWEPHPPLVRIKGVMCNHFGCICFVDKGCVVWYKLRCLPVEKAIDEGERTKNPDLFPYIVLRVCATISSSLEF